MGSKSHPRGKRYKSSCLRGEKKMKNLNWPVILVVLFCVALWMAVVSILVYKILKGF